MSTTYAQLRTAATLTASRAMVSSASGNTVEPSAVTATELGYVAGVTSAIQDQLDAAATPARVLAVGTSSPAVANTATETTLVPTVTGSVTLAANYFVAGKGIRLTCRGLLSTAAVPGTLRIRVRLGGIGGTVIYDTTAKTPTGSLADTLWELSGVIVCRTTGGTGTVMGQSNFSHEGAAAGVVESWPMVNTAAVTIDTTASQAVNIAAEWQTADADNSITLTDFILEQITNPA